MANPIHKLNCVLHKISTMEKGTECLIILTHVKVALPTRMIVHANTAGIYRFKLKANLMRQKQLDLKS